MECDEVSSLVTNERAMESYKRQRTAAWIVSPNHGTDFDVTQKIVNDLEVLITTPCISISYSG